MADGRTSVVGAEPGKCRYSVPDRDDVRKLVAVPGVAIAVLLIGRAAFNRKVVAKWCTDFLDEEFGPESGVSADDVTVERVAKTVKRPLRCALSGLRVGQGRHRARCAGRPQRWRGLVAVGAKAWGSKTLQKL
jgi:hypothetical protein